jgi:hypothetical protein
MTTPTPPQAEILSTGPISHVPLPDSLAGAPAEQVADYVRRQMQAQTAATAPQPAPVPATFQQQPAPAPGSQAAPEQQPLAAVASAALQAEAQAATAPAGTAPAVVVVTAPDGTTYTVPADRETWPVDVLEALEDGKMVRAMRALLGEKQWSRYKRNNVTAGDLNRLYEAVGKACGFESMGE